MKDVFDEKGNRIGFKLESPAEIAQFEEISALAKRLRNGRQERAKLVLAAFEKGNELVDSDDRTGAADAQVWAWADGLDEAIRENLDHQTFGALVELILQSSERAAQTARAVARHAENRSMKAEVFAWLDVHMKDYKSMDDAAEAVAGKGWPIKWRTARDWIAQWKALRSAGTP